MTVLNGEGGLRVGPLKTFTTTLATPRENLLTTPVALPSAEPATAQISFTVLSGDLPTISPSPISMKYTALVYAGGKNADAAAQNVSWRVLKNGTSVATGTQSAVAANQFWTHSYGQFFDAVVGDLLEVKLWSPSANVNYDYHAIAVFPTQPALTMPRTIMDEVTFGASITVALASGTPNAVGTGGWNIYASSLVNAPVNQNAVGLTGAITFGSLKQHAQYNSGRVQNGDISISTVISAHATNRPNYQRNYAPSTISFRELR